MRTLIKYLSVLILVIAVAGCAKPSNGDDPGNKPGGETPGNTNPGNTEPGNTDIPQWNTTGEYIVPEETAKINPNIFILKSEETKVISSDEESRTVRLRFEKDVPKLYGGAVIQYTDKNGEPCLHFVRKVSFSGNEADILYRDVLINEIFYNQSFVVTTNPADHKFQAENIYWPGQATKSDDATLSISVDKEWNVQLLRGIYFTHETGMSLDFEFLYNSGKPVPEDEMGDGEEEEDVWEALFQENQRRWMEDNKDIIGNFQEDDPPTCFAQIKTIGARIHGGIKMSEILEVGLVSSLSGKEQIPLGDLFNKKTPWFQINGVPVRFHYKLSFGLSGAADITASKLALKYSLDTSADCDLEVIYDGGNVVTNRKFEFSCGTDMMDPDLGDLEMELKASADFDLTVAAYGTLGVQAGFSPYLKAKALTFIDKSRHIGFEGTLSKGTTLRAALVIRPPFRDDKYPYSEFFGIDDITINEKPIFKYPDSLEPLDANKAENLIMGYSNKETVDMKVSDKDVANDVKVPTKKALVKVEVLSNMPEGTKGTTRTKDGRTSHGVLFYDADQDGKVPPEFRVPGPMQYDYTFKTSIVGGDKDKDGEGDEIFVKNFYPINRFKSYTATYSASDCAGSTTITVDDYGEKITEKGKFTRTVVYDGYPIVQTYVIDSDFDELFEIADTKIGNGIAYVTANLKHYAGECLYDPVLERLDYIRWDQEENEVQRGFSFTDCNYKDLENCVHAIGGDCSPFFPETDIIYWQNIPVHVATGYLDPECTKYSYLSLESYSILDDGNKDREANEGDTKHEMRPDLPKDALGDEDDGLWGGVIGGDYDSQSGYYVRVDSEQENWEGKYLIVYDETKANSWEEMDTLLPGNLSGIYGSWNGQGTYAENGRILVTSSNENSYFTISRMPDGKYAIYSSKDFYLGCKDSTTAAFDKWAEEPVPNTITYDEANKCILIQGYYKHTLCYDVKGHQFVYVPWDSYKAGGYGPIQLFKLH